MLAYSISIKYMTFGYLVILVVLALYIGSLLIRWRNFKRDLLDLDRMNHK
jgi:hypothetical protein